MMWLGLSICCSSLIFAIFRLFSRWKVDNLTAIVANYLTASALGFLTTGHRIGAGGIENWWWLVLFLGLLFIGLFQVMARVAQKNGMAVASLAVKMSMVIPVAAAFILYGDGTGDLKLPGIALALAAVYLVSGEARGRLNKEQFSIWLLFAGSGLLDTTLKWGEHRWVADEHLGLFTSSLFAAAFVYGVIWKLIADRRVDGRSVLAGFLLGIPNYGSIYFLLKALDQPNWESSALFPLNNLGVVLLSTALGFVFFRESIPLKKAIGLVLGCLAVIFLWHG